LPPITADGARLISGGVPFEVRGVNYIHPSNADLAKCPALQFGADGNCPWELAPIAADLDRLKALGVNTIRVFLNYYVFGGARAIDPTYRMDQPLAHLDSLIAEANRRDIYVLPVLLAKYPQDRFRAQDYAVALDLHVRPVVTHLAGKPGLLAWDLFNEPDLGGPVDQRCWDWDNADFPLCFPLANERLSFVKMLHDEVKRLDPLRLTTVSLGFAKNYFEPHNADLRLADVVDFYAFHYYDDDPYDSGRYAAHWYYGQGFPEDQRRAIEELAALKLDKPIVITELGFPTGAGAKRTADDLRRDLRTALQVARDEQISGVMLWPFQATIDELVGDLFLSG
jgi:endo-1,4-beta-mannosidase